MHTKFKNEQMFSVVCRKVGGGGGGGIKKIILKLARSVFLYCQSTCFTGIDQIVLKQTARELLHQSKTLMGRNNCIRHYTFFHVALNPLRQIPVRDFVLKGLTEDKYFCFQTLTDFKFESLC